MLETVFMVFMAFVSLVCAFAILVVVRDILREHRLDNSNNNKGNEAQPPIATTIQNQPESNIVKEEVKESPIINPIEQEISPDVSEVDVVSKTEENKASIENDTTSKVQENIILTLEERYRKLAPKFRKFYDDIAQYAGSIPGVKHLKNSRYEEFKLKNTRLVRLLVRRDTVVCEFVLPNADFKNYISANKLEVSQSATIMKILDLASVQNAKDSIDIAVRAFNEELAYKKQLAREKQKAARMLKKKAE